MRSTGKGYSKPGEIFRTKTNKGNANIKVASVVVLLMAY